MVICLERGADLHMAQLMLLPLTVSCFSKIQIGFTFLVPAHLGSPGKGPLNGCVCGTTVMQGVKVGRESCTSAKAKYSSSAVPPDTSVHFYDTIRDAILTCARKPT